METTFENSYEQFALYLYLCAAEADFELRPPEIDMIREKMEESGLVDPAEFDKHWHRALQSFNTLNDYESELYIEKSCKDLNLDVAARQKLFDDIKEIMEVDGPEDGPEKMNLFKFKKMLNL